MLPSHWKSRSGQTLVYPGVRWSIDNWRRGNHQLVPPRAIMAHPEIWSIWSAHTPKGYIIVQSNSRHCSQSFELKFPVMANISVIWIQRNEQCPQRCNTQNQRKEWDEIFQEPERSFLLKEDHTIWCAMCIYKGVPAWLCKCRYRRKLGNCRIMERSSRHHQTPSYQGLKSRIVLVHYREVWYKLQHRWQKWGLRLKSGLRIVWSCFCHFLQTSLPGTAKNIKVQGETMDWVVQVNAFSLSCILKVFLGTKCQTLSKYTR